MIVPASNIGACGLDLSFVGVDFRGVSCFSGLSDPPVE
jgi:hypothetical protein